MNVPNYSFALSCRDPRIKLVTLVQRMKYLSCVITKDKEVKYRIMMAIEVVKDEPNIGF